LIGLQGTDRRDAERPLPQPGGFTASNCFWVSENNFTQKSEIDYVGSGIAARNLSEYGVVS
jgi:hypothetical protein